MSVLKIEGIYTQYQGFQDYFGTDYGRINWLGNKLMQDYTEQAKKQGIELKRNESCQFCGALVEKGVFECIERYSLGFDHLDYGDPLYHVARFLSVDAHATVCKEIASSYIIGTRF